jgi:site-specific DNA-methyltransferase (adenine-specific)
MHKAGEAMLDFGFYNMDCMEGMKQFPDKYFELAIVDPPYGSAGNEEWDNRERGRFGGRFDRYKIERTGEAWAEKYGKKIKTWDIAPDKEYFEELFRVSQHQIIWGGNYFNEYLPSNRNFIVWRKLTISESFTMAMAEYAWTSLPGNAKVFEYVPQGNANDKRFHPTQKPVALYMWLLNKYAKPGDKILDTHVGSASSLIACHKLGFKYVGFEIDPDYYRMANERLESYKNQLNLLDLL